MPHFLLLLRQSSCSVQVDSKLPGHLEGRLTNCLERESNDDETRPCFGYAILPAHALGLDSDPFDVPATLPAGKGLSNAAIIDGSMLLLCRN